MVKYLVKVLNSHDLMRSQGFRFGIVVVKWIEEILKVYSSDDCKRVLRTVCLRIIPKTKVYISLMLLIIIKSNIIIILHINDVGMMMMYDYWQVKRKSGGVKMEDPQDGVAINSYGKGNGYDDDEEEEEPLK